MCLILKKIIENVKSKVKKNNYDKYIKKHSLSRMFLLLLYLQCSNNNYGRPFIKKMQAICRSELIPSQGELSKKLSKKLPLSVWEEIYKMLVEESKVFKNKRLKKMIKIVDSTSFEASLSMKWAKHRTTKNGLKVHLMINSDLVPEAFRLKNGNSSDKKSLKWAVNSGFIYIYDKGYNDYKQFKWMDDKNAYFVTRALNNIKYEVLRERKINRKQRRKGILSDKIIEVCIDKKKNIKMKLRLLTYKFKDSNGIKKVYTFLTNNFKLKAVEIADLYKERWQIEVVFRWIKMFLAINHWISRNKNGVMIQLYSALIVYLITILAQKIDNYRIKIMRDYCYYISGIIFKLINFENFDEIAINSS